MSQDIKLGNAEYLRMMQTPLSIAGNKLEYAEPTVARMDGINELVGLSFDIWESNPNQQKPVSRLLLCRFNGDNARVLKLCELCCKGVPEGFDPDAVTGLELGALLQGFFIYYHVRAGTIGLSQKLTQLPTEQPESPTDTSPIRKKSSVQSKTRSSGCSSSQKNTKSSAPTSPHPDSVPTKGS